MAIGELTGLGKLVNNSDSSQEQNNLYINIINIPVSGTYTVTRICFLSNVEVNNITDFESILNFYGDLEQPIIVVGGDYVTRVNSTNSRYAIIDVYRLNQDVRVTYRNSISNSAEAVLYKINGTKPTNWRFYNVKI